MKAWGTKGRSNPSDTLNKGMDQGMAGQRPLKEHRQSRNLALNHAKHHLPVNPLLKDHKNTWNRKFTGVKTKRFAPCKIHPPSAMINPSGRAVPGLEHSANDRGKDPLGPQNLAVKVKDAIARWKISPCDRRSGRIRGEAKGHWRPNERAS